MVQSSSEIKTLTQSDWEDLLPRLLLYTKQRLLRLSWDKFSRFSESTSDLAQEIVMQSLEQVVSGKRQLPEGESLFHSLRNIIDSNVSHTYEHYQIRNRGEEQFIKPEIKNPEQSYEAALLVKEFMDKLSDDPTARNIVELMLVEELTPKEIAERLKLPVTEVYRAMKRIRRRFLRLAGNISEINEGGL